jgi:hypothetical protein
MLIGYLVVWLGVLFAFVSMALYARSRSSGAVAEVGAMGVHRGVLDDFGSGGGVAVRPD